MARSPERIGRWMGIVTPHFLAAAGALGLGCASALAGCEPGWSDGRAGGVGGVVRALCAVENSSAVGRGLFVGGQFPSVGLSAAVNVARWDGNSWLPLGLGIGGTVMALAGHDPDGTGPAQIVVIAGGAFTSAGGAPASRVAMWNGAGWSALGAGVNGPVNAVASFDPDGAGAMNPLIVVGGSFSMAGGAPAGNIAAWNGSAWTSIGHAGNEVVALAVIDPDGPGALPAGLCVGGWFPMIGGVSASRVARWDGAAWSALGDGLSGAFPVLGQCFAWFDADGAGPGQGSLVVGGFFVNAGPVMALGLASWDGASWAGVGGGIGHPAEARSAVVLDDDGDGPAGARLFVAGNYAPVVGGPGFHIAAWDGASWEALGAGLDVAAWSAEVFDDDGDGPDPPALWVGGEFSIVDGLAIQGLARWGCPRVTPPPCSDANGDGVVNFADITAVLASFGAQNPGGGQGDANGDGVVNFADITAVLSAWGMECGE